jgi:4-amino-4-deoxy-L-arabinose transferase-like glycosyltransferase
VLLLALIVANLAVAGWLLLSARAAARPRPARVVAVALLLCAGFLLSLHGLREPASSDVPHPLGPAEDAART